MEKHTYFPRSFTRWQVKSTSLLALSFIPLSGFLFAVLLELKKGERVDGEPLNRKFRVYDYHTLNNLLSIIGIFHALVGYCLHKLMSRVADQVRTRAFLDESASPTELLNSLPASPDTKIFFKSNFARTIVFIGSIGGFLSICGGVLFKQGVVLSTFEKFETATYTSTFVTNCTTDFLDCLGNKYLKYGVALQEARIGGPFSKGVETMPDGSLRLTFVAAPAIPLTSPGRNITRIRATRSLAMVADYRNVTLDEVLPSPNPNKTADVVDGLGAFSLKLTSYEENDLEWSATIYRRDGSTQALRGMTRYCIAECEWVTVDNKLSLKSYNFDGTDCIPLHLGAWNPVSSEEIALALSSDIRDMNWVPDVDIQPAHDILPSGYVVPAMRAGIVLGGWDGHCTKLINHIVNSSPLIESELTCSQFVTFLAIETNVHFVWYLVLIIMTFIAQWIFGYMDPKSFVTAWAPLWFGILPDLQQEDIRRQIRNNLGLKGLGETGEVQELESMMIVPY